MPCRLKGIWIGMGMGAIGAVFALLPWTVLWEAGIGQRLLLILLPCICLLFLLVKYKQINREYHVSGGISGSNGRLGRADQDDGIVGAFATSRRSVDGICLITDVDGYTALAESLDSSAMICLMNRYYEIIVQQIKANGGRVVQMSGDSVLSLWTAPRPREEMASKACQAAFAIMAAIETDNTCNPAHALPTRIGIHAGNFSLGRIGAIDHFEYRPVGDIINTASRLEGLNKVLGTRILVSRQVSERLGGQMTRCMGRFVFKGKTAPTEVHELMAPIHIKNNWHLLYRQVHFRQALEAFQQGRWHEAEQILKIILELFGPDGPTQFYLQQMQKDPLRYLKAGWDGTIILDRK